MAPVLKTTITSFLIAVVNFSIYSESLSPCGSCLCNEERTFADCSNKALLLVPEDLPLKILRLDISHNHIRNLSISQRYQALVELDASNNAIYVLGKNNLAQLFNLTVLDLHQNHLSLSNTTYPKDLFRHQGKLSKLIIHDNSHVERSDLEYPEESISSLISLTYLSIDGLQNAVFGQGFQNLVKLTNLSFEGNCYIRKLKNDTFKYMTNIKFLSIKSCVVTFIEAAAFQPLRMIQELDISVNFDLGVQKFGIGLFGLQNSTIKTLRANRLNTYHGTGVLLRTNDIQYLCNTQLEELHFDENRIEDLNSDVFLYLPTSLKKLSAKGNMFIFGMYFLETSALTGLQWADISDQNRPHVQPFSKRETQLDSVPVAGEVRRVWRQKYVNAFPDKFISNKIRRVKRDIHLNPLPDKFITNIRDKEFDHLKDSPWPGNFTIYIPPNVTSVNVRNSKLSFYIHRIQFGPNKLTKLDLSYNFFTRWQGPIVGLDMLEYIDLSHNYCDYIGDELMKHLISLKFVDFSSNFLGYSLTNNTFKYLIKLEILDLSNNKITFLPHQLLNNTINMRKLILSSNYLFTWNLNIKNMVNLSHIDISNNLFDQFPERLQSQLDTSSGLKVYIKNNPLKCNCQTLSSLKWIHTKGMAIVVLDNVTCTFSDGTQKKMQNLDEFLPELEKACASYVGVLFGVLSAVILVLAILIAGLVYRYRWKLRYLYYLTLNRHRGHLPVQEEEQNFEFDAFVSYADEDRGFVVRDMRRVLEESEIPEDRFRLCIHHRDFLAGEAIAANILKAINTSRKTVVILTRNFLKSYWCRYEVEMAKMEGIYRGRKTLLIVVMEDIPVKDLPVDIVEEMRNDSYIEFTNDRDGQEVFWQNIKRAIRN